MKIKRFNLRLLLLFSILILALSSCEKQKKLIPAPKAKSGVIDLRNWDFKTNGPVRLDGEWALYWKKLLHGSNPKLKPTSYVMAGKGWNESTKKIQSGIGYATMQLQVLIKKNKAKELGIKINEFSTAFELDINGKMIASNGQVGFTESESKPEYKPLLCFLNDESEVLTIVVRVSNFHHFRGGLLQPVLIGSYDELLGYDRTMSRYGGFLYGLLLIIGLFHLGIYLFRRKETYNLYYSIYCIFSCMAYALTNERYLFSVFGPEAWAFSYKFHLTVVPIFVSGLLLFYDSFFKGLIIPWLKKMLLVLGACILLFGVVAPIYIASYLELIIPLYLLLMSLIAIVINSVAIFRKLQSAGLLFTCNLLFLAAFVYDGALVEKQMGNLTLTHLCTVAYVIVISYILSKRFASIFTEAEQLSQEIVLVNKKLEEQNKNLEAEVKMRTQQVVLAEKMSVLGQLTANIAHEINTPLGAIKASINTIQKSYKTSTDLNIELLHEKNVQQLRIINSIIQEALQKKASLSPKDERQIRKKLAGELEISGISNGNLIADYFVRSGFTEVKPEFIDLLKEPGMDAYATLLLEQLEQLINNRNVEMAIEKVSKIMFALKNYSRHSYNGEKALTNIEADIDSVLMLYHNWLKRGITVHTDFGNISSLNCWADELNQVWTNIIMNALQAMGDQGILTITTTEKDGNALVSIGNNGPKIPEEQLEQIFEAFFTTKPHGEGSGLGLDIVKSIVSKHNGTISVESNDEQTLFNVLIPYTS